MASTQRTMNLGRLAELKEQALTLRVEIDAAVKTMIYQFDPMDADLAYVDKIIPERLTIYVKSIDRKKKLLDRLNVEIRRLEEELGSSTS